MFSGAGISTTGFDTAIYDKRLVASIAAIIASLQSDAILGVLEEASNAPNPVAQGYGTTLSYTLLQSVANVRITIYNAYGKVLKEADGGTARGTNTVFWDGNSDSGANLSGVKLLIWQLDIFFWGGSDKVSKQFTMDVR